MNGIIVIACALLLAPTALTLSTSEVPAVRSFSDRTDYYFSDHDQNKIEQREPQQQPERRLFWLPDQVSDFSSAEDLFPTNDDVLLNQVDTSNVLEEEQQPLVLVSYLNSDSVVHPLLLHSESYSQMPLHEFVTLCSPKVVAAAGKSLSHARDISVFPPVERPFEKPFIARIDTPIRLPQSLPLKEPPLPLRLQRERSISSSFHGPPLLPAPHLAPVEIAASRTPPPIYRLDTEVKQLEFTKTLKVAAPPHYYDDRRKVRDRKRYAAHVRLVPVKSGKAKGKGRHSLRKGKSSADKKKKNKHKKKGSYKSRSKKGNAVHALTVTTRHRQPYDRRYKPHGHKSNLKFRTYNRETPFNRRSSSARIKHVLNSPTILSVPQHGFRPYEDEHLRQRTYGHHAPHNHHHHAPYGGSHLRATAAHAHHAIPRPAHRVPDNVSFVVRHEPYIKNHYGYARAGDAGPVKP